MTYQSPSTASDSDLETDDAQNHITFYDIPDKMANSLSDELLKKMDMMMSHLETMSRKMEEQEKRLELQDQTISSLKKYKGKSQKKFDEDSENEDNTDVMQTDSIDPGNEERPRHRTGDLKQFNGERSEWISWRTEAQTKLRIDGRAIGNEEEKFGYLYMHMSVTAQKRIQQWYNLRIKMGTDCTPAAFFERAEGTFGDPNERKNALTLLEVVKQRTDESFSDFVTRFEELLAQAGGEEWAMDLQVNALEKSVNKEMQSRLVSYPLPDPSYNTFRSACLTIDAKLQAMKTWARSTASTASTSTLKPSNFSGSKQQFPSKGQASDRVDNRERAIWASAEERERRRNNGLCLRCGSANHLQKGCKLRSAINTSSKGEKMSVNSMGLGDNIERVSEYQGKV